VQVLKNSTTGRVEFFLFITHENFKKCNFFHKAAGDPATGSLPLCPQTLGMNKFESNLRQKAQNLRTRSDDFVCVAIWNWAFDPFFGFFETISGDINEEQARGKDERPAKNAE
jgi:hypothetical protein